MSDENIRPSTMDGIKRLAKSIKVARDISHTQALDVAAQVAGFENLRHARRALQSGPGQSLAKPRHRIFLTAYWRDKESGARGRETLIRWLGTPWNELISPSQLGLHRALNGYRSEGPDHLAYQNTRPS